MTVLFSLGFFVSNCMADARPFIENIFCCDKLPIVLVISYKMEAFFMGIMYTGKHGTFRRRKIRHSDVSKQPNK